jgi:3-ketosteroid 9alpha-monooxygenase subunit A
MTNVAMLSTTGKRPRFPLPRYPTGWFFVAYSEELVPGQARPITAFGKDLVLFRGEDGRAALLDAHCPHMGAHLGQGKVKGQCVVCPFHAWTYDREGQCVEIPYAKKIPPKARVATWHMRELNGMIVAWHHIDGAPPSWEPPAIPEMSDAGWSGPERRIWKIRTHNQEMGENAVDIAHFRYLHGTQSYPESVVEFGTPVLHMRAETRMTTPRGEVSAVIESRSYGFGIAVNRFTGLVETLVVATQTPVDDEHIEARFNFYVKKLGDENSTKGLGRAFIAEIARQLEQDIPVWENKVYVHPPLLCSGDGPVGKYRKWARQFYPEHYIESAERAFAGR